jgi:hypothetical protein
MTATFTVRNDSRLPVTNAWLGLALPATLVPATTTDTRCDTAATLCRLGALGVGDQQVVSLVLPARAATVGAVSGRLTATTSSGAVATRLAQAPIRVLAPTLSIGPAIGPPGFVTLATGTNYPPGAVVRLNWDFGITATPNLVTIKPDGTFRIQVLVMRKEPLGERLLIGTRFAGTPFGTVPAAQPFLVVPRSLGPPDFDSRR